MEKPHRMRPSARAAIFAFTLAVVFPVAAGFAPGGVHAAPDGDNPVSAADRAYLQAMRRYNIAIRDLALDAVTRWAYVLNVLVEHRNSGRPVPANVSSGLRDGWKLYRGGYLPAAVEGIRRDLVEYGARIPKEPIVGGTAKLRVLTETLAGWATVADAAIEADLQGGDPALLSKAREAQAALAGSLSGLAIEFGQDALYFKLPVLDYGSREAGHLVDGIYRSTVTGIVVPIPANWQSTTFSPDPTVRIRMRRAGLDGEVRVRARWWGEFELDSFPDRLLVLTQESFPAFRLRSGPAIDKPDGGAERLSVAFDFDSTMSKAGPTWQVRSKWVYDRRSGLAYGLECMLSKAPVQALSEELDALLAGFALAPAKKE